MIDPIDDEERRVHGMMEALRTLRIEVSEDFIRGISDRIERLPQITGPGWGRVVVGFLSQLANLVAGNTARDDREDEKPDPSAAQSDDPSDDPKEDER